MHPNSITQRILHLLQINFFCTKKENPSEGGGVRGAALSTGKQTGNPWRKLTCDVCMLKNDGAS